MKVYPGISGVNETFIQPVITIGNFDGFHIGHQKIVRTAVEIARKMGGTAIGYTFRPHPQVALKPDQPVQLLTTYDEKLDLLREMGLDVIIEEPFNQTFSQTEPEFFFHKILLGQLKARAIVVGYDFGFGKQRGGHLSVLKALCEDNGVELTVIPPLSLGEEVVSSSKIRHYLLNGNMERASYLLGRPYSYQGEVIHGDARGRKLGFPTANLKLENKLTLPLGVYATRTWVGGVCYSSVTNIGVRPTFQDSSKLGKPPVLLETHLLDTSIDLYGKKIKVEFESKIRDEKKFDDLNALRNQIASDIGMAIARLRDSRA